MENGNDNNAPNQISAIAADAVVTDSICHNDEGSKLEAESDKEQSLEVADDLMAKGSEAVKAGDLVDAVDLFSRALEIRVQHYGELAPECVKAYYKYGLALLYKAQDESDPLVSAPKSGGGVQDDSAKDAIGESLGNGESSTTSAVSSNVVQDRDSKKPDAPNGKGLADSNAEEQEEVEDDGDGENSGDGDEDDSDLDLAWKMLDVARAIVENVPGDTIEKVDILSALAEVALERDDIETSLNDYLNALPILERLVEPDSRLIAELNFRICICLEMGSKADDAILYCQKAISICKSRVDRLQKEVISKSDNEASLATVDQGHGQPSEISLSEIDTLTGLTTELEKKLEDLQQLVANPSSVLSEIMEIMAARGKGNANGASVGASSSRLATAGSSGGELQSPTVSTAHTNGQEVTNLGVVGRGVKRVSTNTENSETKQAKRIAPTPVEKSEGSSS